MNNKAKEALEKQLQLLLERSDKEPDNHVVYELTVAMVQVADALGKHLDQETFKNSTKNFAEQVAQGINLQSRSSRSGSRSLG